MDLAQIQTQRFYACPHYLQVWWRFSQTETWRHYPWNNIFPIISLYELVAIASHGNQCWTHLSKSLMQPIPHPTDASYKFKIGQSVLEIFLFKSVDADGQQIDNGGWVYFIKTHLVSIWLGWAKTENDRWQPYLLTNWLFWNLQN